MPITGMGFFEAAGDVARQLDRSWAQRVDQGSCAVVLLLHEEGLTDYLPVLDAEFVIGVPEAGCRPPYAGLSNVTVVPTGDPMEVTRAAIEAWSRCFEPATEEPGRAQGTQAQPDLDALADDRALIDALFGNRPAGPDPDAEDAPTESPPPLPDLMAMPAANPEPVPMVDPLAALAGVKPAPVIVNSGREPLTAPPEAPDPGDGGGQRPIARTWLDRARSLVIRTRPIAVPDEIGDLLLGARPAPVVVVGSRKGGVGKTALSAGLAQVCGYALDGRAGVAALVDQNINNADQWGRLMVPAGVGTVREIMGALESGEEFPPAPTFARTPALAVYPESRDPGDGYPAALVELFVRNLRNRHVVSVIDLPNSLPAYTSAEAGVAAAYIAQADLALVPTTDDPNALRGALEYLDTASMRFKTAVVPYIVSPEKGIREDPRVLELLNRIRDRTAALVPFPKTEKATLAIVKGTSVLDVDTRLRNAYIELASSVARVLVGRAP
jgi:MinD-like ATPase involved in chromosome partitioning or flagellar assembly